MLIFLSTLICFFLMLHKVEKSKTFEIRKREDISEPTVSQNKPLLLKNFIRE